MPTLKHNKEPIVATVRCVYTTMTTISSTTEPKSKRNIILTDRMCEKRVAKRVKNYDRK